jgi:D-alanine-D-alanine ligase
MGSSTNTRYKNNHIGVLMGGASAERAISLRTGKAVLRALRAKKYQADSIDVTTSIAQALLKKKIEVAFIALHGKGGEDGIIQGTLEMLHIPYTGSGVLASALAMHKGMTKKILRYHRIPTADFQVITAETIERVDFHRTINVPLPLVVKPIAEGSTIGTSIVAHKRHLRNACRQAASCDRSILLERFIEGTELTTGIVNGAALPLIEIVPRDGFYSFRSKYTPGSTDYIVPARITKSSTEKIQQLSIRAYHALRCEGVARVDLIFSHRQKRPYILEINTIPGMTETSLLPMAAKSAGIEFNELVEKILHTARLKAL